jgi:hypothetical protein
MPEAPAPMQATRSLVGFEWYCFSTRYGVAISGYEKVLASLAALSALFVPFVPFVPFVADGDMDVVVDGGICVCEAKKKTLFISMRKRVQVRSRRRGREKDEEKKGNKKKNRGNPERGYEDKKGGEGR